MTGPEDEVKYLAFAFLADGATERGGSLNALGIGVNIIGVASLPTVHITHLVLRLAWQTEAHPGVRDMQIRFVAPSGKEIAGIGAQFAVDGTEPNPHPELGSVGNMVWPVPLQLEELGVHHVEITIEGTSYPPILFKVVPAA